MLSFNVRVARTCVAATADEGMHHSAQSNPLSPAVGQHPFQPARRPWRASTGAADNVLIELIANISPSYIAQFSGKFPVGFKSVSGVGDEARSFSQALGGGKDNEGVVATKGSTIVAIVATDTPASLTQIEALVNQLR